MQRLQFHQQDFDVQQAACSLRLLRVSEPKEIIYCTLFKLNEMRWIKT